MTRWAWSTKASQASPSSPVKSCGALMIRYRLEMMRAVFGRTGMNTPLGLVVLYLPYTGLTDNPAPTPFPDLNIGGLVLMGGGRAVKQKSRYLVK